MVYQLCVIWENLVAKYEVALVNSKSHLCKRYILIVLGERMYYIGLCYYESCAVKCLQNYFNFNFNLISQMALFMACPGNEQGPIY